MTVSRARAFLRAGVVAAAVVAVDQAAKALVTSSLERGERLDVLPGLDLTHVGNTGVAFGALQGGGRWIVALSVLALVLLLVYFARNAERPRAWLPVGLVLGGALGNLVDRALEGAVIDFIDPVAWPAFNLADAAIVLGVLGLLVVVESRAGRRRRPGAAAEARPEP